MTFDFLISFDIGTLAGQQTAGYLTLDDGLLATNGSAIGYQLLDFYLEIDGFVHDERNASIAGIWVEDNKLHHAFIGGHLNGLYVTRSGTNDFSLPINFATPSESEFYYAHTGYPTSGGRGSVLGLTARSPEPQDPGPVTQPAPEPAIVSLLASGGIAGWMIRQRRRHQGA